jgi:hypothetical protein
MSLVDLDNSSTLIDGISVMFSADLNPGDVFCYTKIRRRFEELSRQRKPDGGNICHANEPVLI